MTALYPWLKALHIIAVIAWMAGLLYLPRLFINHVGLAPGSEASNMLNGMEGRLLRIIMRPAAAATFLFGIGLLFVPGVVDWSLGWIWLKLALVAGLGFAHGHMEKWRAAFAADRNQRSARFFRMINEVPTLLMIGIVLLVVAKPF
ncbi:MAG: protoporphyrinogen oxidase HemJ [Rhodospirillaceae bacterium]|nr:protoporphyrinogen oxidase HemJ [Rhodospirillaceae bacterium]